MKKSIFVLLLIFTVLALGGLAFAQPSCCLKKQCKCKATTCCENGKCACKGNCCAQADCQCLENKCGLECKC